MKLGETCRTPRWRRSWPSRAACRTRSTPQNAWELDRHARDRDGRAAAAAAATPTSTTLSGGERRRVALCRLLLQPNDMLLLDEPTNHLDAESVAWLERYLKEYTGTVVAVTHDRYFLDNVAGWILELDRGAGIPWEGNYSSWLEQKEQPAGAGGEGESRRAAARLERELEWVRMAPARPPGQGQGPPQPLRGAARRGAGGGEARRRARDHDPAGAAPRRPGHRGQGPAQGLRRQPADGRRDLHPAARRHRRRHRPERRRQDDAVPHDRRPGEARRRARCASATRCVLSYVDQSRDTLDGKRTLWEEISDGGKDLVMVGKREVNSRAYAASFNFRGPDQQKKVKDLSGGERNRLHLAKLLKSGGNLLLLDEPTNDLDVDTLRALEEALVELRRLRGRHQPRPLVPRPHRHPHPRLRGRQPRWSGSRATTRTTRPTGTAAWAPTPTSRTASSTASWPSNRHSRLRLGCATGEPA